MNAASFSAFVTKAVNKHYGLFGAVAAVLMGSIARWLVDPLVGELYPFVTYIPCIVVVAIAWGARAGLLATLLGALTGAWLFVSPRGSFKMLYPADQVAMAVLLGTGALMCIAAAAVTRARAQNAADKSRADVNKVLATERERLRLALEVSAAGSFEWDIRQNVNLWSHELLTLYGLSSTDFDCTREAWLSRVVLQDRDLCTSMVQQAFRTGHFACEFRVRRADTGEVHWLLGRGRVFYGSDGAPERMIGINVDITERKRAENALRESELRFRTMADDTPEIIWVTNAQGEIQFVNRAYCEFFGTTLQQVQTDGWQPLVHPDDDRYVTEFVRCLQEQAPFSAEGRIQRHDGDWRWVQSHGRPRFSGSGEFLGIAGTSVDITEKKAWQTELERRVAERTRLLAEANEQLNAFCYSVAHDLKAPLRAQATFASIVEEEYAEELGETGRDYVRRIARAAEKQHRLIDDLLTQVRIGRSDMALGPLPLAATAIDVIAELREEIRQRSATIDTSRIAHSVKGNASALHLVVLNLVTNAIKFVPPSRLPIVRLWSERRPETSPSSGLQPIRLWVEDNGVGIAPENRQRIFGAFERVGLVERYPGSGMGLAIVAAAVKRMGGSCGVESTEGEGSRFWVDLPPVPETDGAVQRGTLNSSTTIAPHVAS